MSIRTINYEVGTLRGILKSFGLWGHIADKIETLKEKHDVGRALTRDEEDALINAAGKSRSPALLPLLIFSLDTGMRASEVRSLRRGDLALDWDKGRGSNRSQEQDRSRNGPNDSSNTADLRDPYLVAVTLP